MRWRKIGTATASSELNLMGIRDPHIRGPLPLKPGRSVAGPALTLQIMPKREDLFGGREYDNPDLQLHRHVLYPAQAGDMVVVDARGDMARHFRRDDADLLRRPRRRRRGGRRLHPRFRLGARSSTSASG